MLERANDTVKHIMGENGIMKNKFLEFQKELEEAERELKEVCDQKKELYDIIRCCERDMRYETVSFVFARSLWGKVL